MTNEEIKSKVNVALKKLYFNEFRVIQCKTNENCISHKFAEYLQQEFVEYNVDCEYDRNNCSGERHTKFLDEYKERMISIYHEPVRGDVRPDIIVHTRFSNANNILVIEAKKDKEPNENLECKKAIEKVKAFTEIEVGTTYHFQLGLYFKINTSPVSFDLYWVKQGNIEEDAPIHYPDSNLLDRV